MDFDPFEYAVDRVRIFACKPLCLFQRIGLNDDKAASLIRKRAGEHDSSCLVERFHVGQVSRTVDLSFGFSLGTIKTNNDEFHC